MKTLARAQKRRAAPDPPRPRRAFLGPQRAGRRSSLWDALALVCRDGSLRPVTSSESQSCVKSQIVHGLWGVLKDSALHDGLTADPKSVPPPGNPAPKPAKLDVVEPKLAVPGLPVLQRERAVEGAKRAGRMLLSRTCCWALGPYRSADRLLARASSDAISPLLYRRLPAEYRTRHLIGAQALPSVCMYSLANSAGRACCAALSPDCSAAAVGYSDSSVLFWDMEEAARVHKEAWDERAKADRALREVRAKNQVAIDPQERKVAESAARIAEEAEKQVMPGHPQARGAAGAGAHVAWR